MMRLCLLAVLAIGCARGADELQLVDVKRGDLVVGVVVTGELEAVDSTDIKPPGVANVWHFKLADIAAEGAEVKQGQPIVAFDTSELRQELEQVMTEVEAAKKQIDKKRDDAALARREETLQIAQAEAGLKRAQLKTATPGELIASVDLKVAKLDEEAAKIGLELAKNKAAQARRSDETELASLRDKLAYATTRLELLKTNIGKMEVTAPRDGTIVYPSWGGEKIKVGDNIWRMQVVVQVVSLAKMIGKGAVDEVDIARVAPGQPVMLRLDALPDVQLSGKVESIARSVRARSQTDRSRVIDIKITLDATKAPLRPGMRFRGEVETERVANVVMIPSDAVFVTPEGPVAFRNHNGSIERVKIKLGRRSSTMIEVTSGLAPGDRVSRSEPGGNS